MNADRVFLAHPAALALLCFVPAVRQKRRPEKAWNPSSAWHATLAVAGMLFVVRWWVETHGADRTSHDRRVALLVVGLSLSPTLPGVLLEMAGAP
ncbi:hypothetical protein GCM10011374_01480 [Kocuria dechangensis]|uniref:Uncharacterized protein n=1 Tax=Kocuria dechangensis TaxID=1176249 RepID=A0A917GEV2_9MICC|nr:hypothetical protein [Kocuria dechangensis]GGG42776.1 hypothetical protein GCM10011374_01480 [Kocuria dechangensis]